MPEQEADAVVVGAGVAGLVAATTLHEAGANVVCLEARDRVGGRTLSRDGWVDLGATWLWDNEPAIASTVASLGLPTYPQAIQGNALFEQPGQGVVRLAGNPIDVPAWRVDGGMQAVALALAARLPAGIVQTGTSVASITFEPDEVVCSTADGRAVRGQMVVLAVPPSLAVASIAFRPDLAPGLAHAAAAVHTWMSDTVKAVAVFPEPFWRGRGLAGAAFSHAGPFREFHDHSGPKAGQAAIFGFAPASLLEAASERVVAREFTAQLGRLWGPEAAHPSRVHVLDWSRERFTATSGAAPSASLGYGNPLLQAPHMGGRLVFASTETAAAFAGHVEGAILAGRRAARQALGLFEHQRPPLH